MTPADIGVTVGPGVVDAYPTTVIGHWTISTPGAVLENVIVDGCVDIVASNVTLRNVVITGGEFIQGVKDTRCWYPLWLDPGHSNALIEYSEIKCSHSSIVILIDGYTDVTVKDNYLHGCDDAFRIDGDLETLVIDRNVITLRGGPKTHADGLQIGESVNFPRPTTGTIQITRNWFSVETVDTAVTAAMFATNQASLTDILFENNRVSTALGVHVLRCVGQPSNHCTIRGNTLVDAGATLNPFDNFVLATTPTDASCNVWDTGAFIEQSRFDGVAHVTTGC